MPIVGELVRQKVMKRPMGHLLNKRLTIMQWKCLRQILSPNSNYKRKSQMDLS